MAPVAGLRVRPGGREPEAMENASEPELPVTFILAEYGLPAIALALEQDPQVRLMGEGCTTRVQVTVSLLPFESVTFEVKVNVPAALGVPLMMPVEAFRVRPAGNEPELME